MKSTHFAKHFRFVSLILVAMAVSLSGGCSKPSGKKTSQHTKNIKYNILLITVDTLRADQLNCYGQDITKTPVMNKLASEGVLFEQVFPSIPFTPPSIFSILTSHFPHNFHMKSGLNYRMNNNKYTTIAEALKAEGYITYGISGSHVIHSKSWHSRGFDNFVDSGNQTMLPSGQTADSTIQALDTLASTTGVKEGNKNFLIWAHFMDPHMPFTPPEEFDVYKGSNSDNISYSRTHVSAGKREFTEEYKENIPAKYRAEVTYTDFSIGRVIEKLNALGLSESTVIILTADHGVSFGLHDQNSGYKYTLYQDTVHVPLIVKHPKIKGGQRISNPVSLLDIMPSILEITGTEYKEMGLEGVSLFPALTGDISGIKNRVLFSQTLGFSDLKDVNDNLDKFRPPLQYRHSVPLYPGQWTMVISDNVKTIRIPTLEGVEYETYSFSADEIEANNLLLQEESISKKNAKKIEDFLRENATVDTTDKIDEESLKRLRDLGYVK